MKKSMAGFMLVVALVTFCTASGAQLNDPYEILNKYYQALGGLDKLKANKTSHVEGTIVIEGTGLQGTFLEWAEAPIKKRQDVDLTIFKQQSGDNGQFPWSVDQNGKLQIIKDEKRLKDRTVDSLLGEFEHLNRDSKYFTVTFEGIDTAAGKDCYVVRTKNSLNEDVLVQYVDPTDFLLVKQVSIGPDGEQHAIFSDYRRVGDVLTSFKQEMILMPTMMRQVVQITLAEFNVPVDPQLFEPPSADVKDFRFINGKSAENIPFQFIDNHIYLMVEVAGKTRLWVLDTGASVTVIENEFADELGLKKEGKVKGQGAGQLVDVSFTTLPSFSLPGLEFNEQKVAVIELNWLFRQWIGRDVAGILGYDFLSRVVTKVDYANQTLSFYDADSFSYTGTGVVLDAPVTSSGSFEPTATVDGKYTGPWNVDLGAGGLSFHYPYAEKNGLLDRPGIDGLGFGAGGSSPTKKLLFDNIQFAGYTIKDPVISVPQEKGEGAFAAGDLTGNLGNTLFRHFVLYLDYAQGKIIVEKGADFGRDFPRDNSGLQAINNKDDRLEVLFVADKTPASRAGFKPGDVIVSINGVDAEYLDGIVAFNKLLQKKPGTKFAVIVSRGGQEVKLNLILADLYRK